MSLLRSLGKKHMELATLWLNSGMTYGMASGVLVVYMTDWRAVLQYLPYYSGKYPKEEES